MSPAFLAAAAVPLVILGVVILARKRLQRHLFGDDVANEIDTLRTESRELTNRDRWVVQQAVSHGRAAPAPLQDHAVRRAELALASLDRLESNRWLSWTRRRRWVWVICGVVLVSAALNLARLLSGDALWWPLIQTISQVGLACLLFFGDTIKQHQRAQMRRAIVVNGGGDEGRFD